MAPHFRLVGSRRHLARSRRDPHRRQWCGQGFRRSARTVPDADVFRMTLDPGATVTYVAELHAEPAAALRCGSRTPSRIRKDQPHPLQGHRHRHRRTVGPVPDHRSWVKARSSSRRRSPRLGGARLYRHRFRLLGKVFGVTPTPTASGAPRRKPSCRRRSSGSVRLSQSQPLACARTRSSWPVGRVPARWSLALFDPPVAPAGAYFARDGRAGFLRSSSIWRRTAPDRAVMLIPTWFLLLAWVTAAGFAVSGSIQRSSSARL